MCFLIENEKNLMTLAISVFGSISDGEEKNLDVTLKKSDFSAEKESPLCGRMSSSRDLFTVQISQGQVQTPARTGGLPHCLAEAEMWALFTSRGLGRESF